MSLQLNLSTHTAALQTAYKSVLSGDPSCEWAVFGYDKGTNDLKVMETGDGGLEELNEAFSDGKIQYAFCRVVDPNTELPKFVLISWCGSGVPETKKGLFPTHLATVQSFLKGYHVQINARQDSDVDPVYIMKRINESGGSKYSVHREKPVRPERPATVGTAYTPVKPEEDIARLKAQAKAAPVQVSAFQKARQEEDKARVEQEKRNREQRERHVERERFNKERAEKRQQEQAERDQKEERQQREQVEREKAQEAEQRQRQQQAQEAQKQRDQAQEQERRKQEQAERERQQAQEKREQAERERAKEQIKAAKQELVLGLEALVLYDYSATAGDELALAEGEVVQVTDRSDSEWWRGTNGTGHGLFPASYVRLLADPDADGPSTIKGAPEVTAIALFDFDASADDEISFTDGERLVDIIQDSDDWWIGTNAGGKRGLFPATYVELS
jgi:hypothetical protein